jgi:hypothetical protein
VVAAHDGEDAPGIGKKPFFNLFDPGSKYPDRHFMLLLAGCGAGVATNTFAVIDDKSELHGVWFRSPSIYFK